VNIINRMMSRCCSLLLVASLLLVLQVSLSNSTRGKSWPELVGKTSPEATTVITTERPDLYVVVMNINDPSTDDFQPDRVLLVTNDHDIVLLEPYIG